jgi:hypothetical protein
MQTESEESRESILHENMRSLQVHHGNSNNLHMSLIKWYSDEQVNSSKQMRDQNGIGNTSKLNLSLSNLLTTIHYRKLGYISENILNMFRDFCAIEF